MLQLERTNILLSYLEEHHSATVKQIARDVHMSETTVRRDLKSLEEQHLVRRSYGFAELLKYRNNTLPFVLRKQENRKEKAVVAEKAVSLIRTGETVFFDESSTVGMMVRFLDQSAEITVVTNSLSTAAELAEKRIRTYCTGGLVAPDTLSFCGRHADPILNAMRFDKCFLSSSGLSDSGLICDKEEENASLKRRVLSRSAQKFYLCDHSKFGLGFPYVIAEAARFDRLISDCPPPAPYAAYFPSSM